MAMIDSWGVRFAGLFTFAASAKHVALYEKYGFWPRFLTAIMSRPVLPPPAAAPGTLMSGLAAADRDEALARPASSPARSTPAWTSAGRSPRCSIRTSVTWC